MFHTSDFFVKKYTYSSSSSLSLPSASIPSLTSLSHASLKSPTPLPWDISTTSTGIILVPKAGIPRLASGWDWESMTRIIGNRGLDVSDGGRRASRRRSCSSSYVNRSGSEEGLYGLKSRRIGLEWVSSRIISNVSVGQRRGLRLMEHGNTGEYMEMFVVKEGRSQRGKRRRHTITSTSIISHYLIFEERSQSLLDSLQDLGILEVWIVVIISDTSSFSSATISLPSEAVGERGTYRARCRFSQNT